MGSKDKLAFLEPSMGLNSMCMQLQHKKNSQGNVNCTKAKRNLLRNSIKQNNNQLLNHSRVTLVSPGNGIACSTGQNLQIVL